MRLWYDVEVFRLGERRVELSPQRLRSGFGFERERWFGSGTTPGTLPGEQPADPKRGRP